MKNSTIFGTVRSLAVAFLILSPMAVDAPAETAPVAPASPVRPAVERGLQFLQKEAYRWKGARQCAACHHAALVVWSFNEARARGYSVDEHALNEITEWSVTNIRENVRVPQPPPRDVINLGASYVLLSLETAPASDHSSIEPSAGPGGSSPATDKPATENPAAVQVAPIPADLSGDLHALLQHIVTEQEADGAWGLPLDERAPLGGPVEDIAILSRMALLQSGDHSTTVTAGIERAKGWLAVNHDPQSRQARNFRLLMNIREGKPAEEINPDLTSIKAEQNADGGWSQTPEMASDAYATGQTLYIMARAGLKPEDNEMARGVEFLTRTQREEGSWPMTSRVDSKDMTPITAAGAAWAVLGLVRASP